MIRWGRLLIAAVAIGAVINYTKPEVFQRIRPMVETVLHDKLDEGNLGKYSCILKSVTPPISQPGGITQIFICNKFGFPVITESKRALERSGM